MADGHAGLDVLYDRDAIASAISDLAAAIARELAGRPTFVVPVMNGALFFAADLLRALGDLGTMLPVVGFGAASVTSYAGTSATPPDALDAACVVPAGPPRIAAFPSADRIAGRVVLVVDTIVDTGATLDVVAQEARSRGALDVRVACLIDKPGRRRAATRADWVAFTAPDRFLVGYGLDAGGRWRTLPYVAAVEPVAPPR